MALADWFQSELKQAGLHDETSSSTSTAQQVPDATDISQASEDVFVDAVSEQSSLYEETRETPMAVVETAIAPPSQSSDIAADSACTQIEPDNQNMGQQGIIGSESREQSVDNVETQEEEEPAKKVPKVLDSVPAVSKPVPSDTVTQWVQTLNFLNGRCSYCAVTVPVTHPHVLKILKCFFFNILCLLGWLLHT